MTVFISDVAFRLEAREIAAALAERHIPFSLHTSAVVGDGSRVAALAARLPRPARRRADALLQRRRLEGVAAANIQPWLFPDAIANASRRLGVPDTALYLAMNAAFDGFVAGRLPRTAKVAVAMSGSALSLLRRASEREVRSVLIVNAPDPEGESEILAREASRLGLPSPDRGGVTQRLAKRLRNEVALADVVLANSEFTKGDLIDHGARSEKVVVASLGIDASIFSPGDDGKRDGSVLYVGSVKLRKGVVHLADAVRHLRADGLEVWVDAYGYVDPAYRAVIEPYVADGSLRLYGPLWGEDLVAAYRSAQVFVLPTLSDGFGLVVYEAMASGVPVIVTDRCGAPVESERTGLVVPHADSAGLAHAIARILGEPQLASRLAAAALPLARNSRRSYRERVLATLEPLLAEAA